ncbi:hypothetical protein IQ238_28875 [Pleurocapsales cyanobacterium LEGE 06147]|nr:hypothetical protein [Pleurocapsales cyanobacterium LEGE 06147]
MVFPDELATQRISALASNACALFFQPVWESALVLLVETIVVTGKRTVSAILQVMELHHELQFQRFWQARLFQLSSSDTDVVKMLKALLDCWSDLLCYAA